MGLGSNLEICPDCKGEFPEIPGGVRHAYLGGSPGCWKAYGELLAREYQDPAYMRFHRWTVDAYAAQHPGHPELRAIQSVHVHLFGLYLLVERGADPHFVTKAMGGFLERNKGRLEWLEPPASPARLTVQDVLAATTAEQHGKIARDWAGAVWTAWKKHHPLIRSMAGESEAIAHS